MGDRRCRARACQRYLLSAAAVLTLGLGAVGCSSGPSQEELSLLEERHQAMVAAETKVAQKKAEKARLERKLADRKAELKAAQQRQADTQQNLANFPKE